MFLVIRNLRKSFRSGERIIEVLRGVNLSIEKGKKIAIVGPSGSGKTTLLNLIGTIDMPDEGEIYFRGERIDFDNEEKLSEIRKRHIGFVFQFYHLMPELTVEENIKLPGLMVGLREIELKERLESVLRRLNLVDKRDSKIYPLSGGERQKVAIGRAIFLSPELLLADEPTGNLDPESTQEVFNIFMELSRDQGITLIVVTHNLELAKKMDKIYLLKEGILLEYEKLV